MVPEIEERRKDSSNEEITHERKTDSDELIDQKPASTEVCDSCGAACFTPFCPECGARTKVPGLAEVADVAVAVVPRVVVVLGRTGQGKSTLCNVLMSVVDEEDALFVIGHEVRRLLLSRLFFFLVKFLSSCTENVLALEHEHDDGLLLRVVDTVGWGNTQVVHSDVLLSLVHAAKEWGSHVCQFMYVCSEKISREEIAAFRCVRKLWCRKLKGSFFFFLKNFHVDSWSARNSSHDDCAMQI